VMARQEEFIRKNGNLDTVLREQVQTAEKWQIWHAMNELRYIFRHSLLREAAYDMQLGARLRELHQLIAEAIEKLYPHSEERYVDLAFHYEEAENIHKTHKYLEKAADYARRNFQNKQALKFYDKLIASLSENKSDKTGKITKLMLRKGALLELTGQWSEAETIFRESLARTLAQNAPDLIGRSNRRLGQLLMMRGDYEQARNYLDEAILSYQKANDQIGLAKTFGNLGALYFRQGAYEQAKNWFAKAIEINRARHRETENASIVANMGLIYMNQGHYDEGIRRLEEQLNLTERAKDKPGLATIYTNLGIIFLEKNSLDSALICLEKGLALSEELGNKFLMTICIGSIGSVWEKKGDYAKAMQHFERDLDLCHELGDKQGTAIACGLMGDLLSLMGEFDRSNIFLEKEYALSQELNYKKGVAKALNTLGDNFFFSGDFEKSIHYYSLAIERSRELGNKLILGYSLIEKGFVHTYNKEAAPARILLEEGRDIALTLDNSDLNFGANILHAQILILENERSEAVRRLQQMLLSARNERDEAAIHFELRRVADNPIPHHIRALTLYRNLFEKTPQYLFKWRIKILEGEIA
ncbi:MAG: tetratricopeptide repeat protein, partial [Saprospiraceae bacterium]